jgi:hypothetical protein
LIRAVVDHASHEWVNRNEEAIGVDGLANYYNSIAAKAYELPGTDIEVGKMRRMLEQAARNQVEFLVNGDESARPDALLRMGPHFGTVEGPWAKDAELARLFVEEAASMGQPQALEILDLLNQQRVARARQD